MGRPGGLVSRRAAGVPHVHAAACSLSSPGPQLCPALPGSAPRPFPFPAVAPTGWLLAGLIFVLALLLSLDVSVGPTSHALPPPSP